MLRTRKKSSRGCGSRFKRHLMRKILACLGLLFICSQVRSGAVPIMAQTSGPMSLEMRQSFVNQYCSGCHNDKAKTGGFSFTAVDLKDPSKSAEIAEKVILKLRAGMMPPAGR